ncbi:ethanolamine ammonia-lyase subunit EutC [Deinococcus sp.]|uniref:ethanolamine ammonia-lyase subunit EutC n=1 Tax=Deinococcus sp. TaxID=47478 RepID=UPI0025D6A6CB|nr:ethanolamine ammonia-lyase subunit EutC [Deinococcus sp.]
MSDEPGTLTPWDNLRRYTDARIAQGRVGTSVPTAELLKFQQAHALARDAVHAEADFSALSQSGLGQYAALHVRSRAAHRSEYLRRPDLGRRLHPDSARLLQAARTDPPPDVLMMVSDGLSALSVRQAQPLLDVLLPGLLALGLNTAPLLLATQARVALADEAAVILGARLVIHLIGERPGLSSPDSLGAYLTYQPTMQTLDSARNCVSNIRPAGLDAGTAARRLLYLAAEALRRGLSGVDLKDESAGPNTVLNPTTP